MNAIGSAAVGVRAIQAQAAPIAAVTSATAAGSIRRRHSGCGVRACAAAAADVASDPSGWSSTKIAAAISPTRFARFFSRQPWRSTRTAAGTVDGSAFQSGSPRSTAASVSLTSSPSNARRPVSIS